MHTWEAVPLLVACHAQNTRRMHSLMFHSRHTSRLIVRHSSSSISARLIHPNLLTSCYSWQPLACLSVNLCLCKSPAVLVFSAELPQDIVDVFFSSEGIHSTDLLEQRAANLAISSVMADAPASMYLPLHAALVTAIDHREHDAISPTEVKIYFTPAGQSLRCCIIEAKT